MIWEVRCGAEAGRESVGKAVEWMVVVGNSEQMRPKSPRERTCRQYPDLQTFRTPDLVSVADLTQKIVVLRLRSASKCRGLAGSQDFGVCWSKMIEFARNVSPNLTKIGMQPFNLIYFAY